MIMRIAQTRREALRQGQRFRQAAGDGMCL